MSYFVGWAWVTLLRDLATLVAQAGGSRGSFRADGLLLRFLRMDDLTYPQFKHPFVPSLSIIDVLMFNSREQLKDLLLRFSVFEGHEKRAALATA